jgi:hypothetical protein
MNKEKRIWIALFLALTLMLILSGCSGLPKTAKINITINPNPVPYDTEEEEWSFNLILTESNGVGVTLISLRFDGYDQAEELIYTNINYEEDIIYWFGSNYLPAFSSLSSWVWHIGTSKYAIITVAGVDDNNNPIEATGRVDFLPQ